MPKKKMRRNVVVVDRKLQLGIALRLIGWLGYYLVLFCILAVGGPLLLKTLSPEAAYTLEDAIAELFEFGQRLAIPLALTCLCLILHSLSLLNRVSGPVYRLKGTLLDMAEGNLERDVVLRPRDYLQDLASTCNETASALRTDFSSMKEMVATISDRVFELSQSSGFEEGSLDELRVDVQELGQLLELYRLPTREAAPRESGESPAPSMTEATESPVV